MLTLKDHNVPPESKLHLIIVLWAVPDELENAVFDFYWGLPRGRDKDYLDVSVLVYSGRENLGVIYYRDPYLSLCPGVVHSGPADMYYYEREGRHQVKVNLKIVPHHVDKLVFTLSAWRSSSISEYPHYRLNFYDVNFPGKQLCTVKVDHLEDYKSIIMCCLSKKNGRWEVRDIKKGSDGFTRNYYPIKQKIEKLIQKGFLWTDDTEQGILQSLDWIFGLDLGWTLNWTLHWTLDLELLFFTVGARPIWLAGAVREFCRVIKWNFTHSSQTLINISFPKIVSEWGVVDFPDFIFLILFDVPFYL